MREEKLSQFIVDPITAEDYEITVPANWLKKIMKDYHKATLEIKALQDKINKKDYIIEYMKETSNIVKLNIHA